LTHKDLLDEEPFYSKGPDTPYVFIFCGTESYGRIRQLANEPGTDGTVRWAGCSLSTQKITIDLTRDPDQSQPMAQRATATDNTLETYCRCRSGRSPEKTTPPS
jgi:hypothetical protein